MKARKSARVALLSAGLLLAGATTVYAATATVTSSIKFLTHLTVSETTGPDFGAVNDSVGDTYVLTTADGLTAGTSANIEGLAHHAGSYSITASTLQAVSVKVGGFTPSAHATPSLPTCDWDGSGSTPCGTTDTFSHTASTGTSTLKLGLTMTTTSGATDGTTETPTGTITILYQ